MWGTCRRKRTAPAGCWSASRKPIRKARAPTVSRVNAWFAAASHQDGPLFRRVRRDGRVEGDPGRRLSVNAISQIIRSRAAAVGIEGRVSDHSLRVGGAQSLAAGGGLDCRDADGGQVAVTGDAGPLCTGPVGCTGRRRSRPLRSRIKASTKFGSGI